MNAPLQRPNWQRDLLQAAIQQLQVHYRHTPSACIALHISRNYRLLLTHHEQPQIKDLWRVRSRYWWQLYCEQSKIRSVDVPNYGQFDLI